MLSTKKAQGMSLNTIIIAIIVLIVLVVLIMIFTGYFGRIFTPTVGSCTTQGGKCVLACNTADAGYEIQNAKCAGSLKCCANVPDIAEVGAPTASATTSAAAPVTRAPPTPPADG